MSGESGDAAALWLEVRCERCREIIRTRVDTRYELRQDVENGQEVRVLDKDLLGTRCFALLHVHALLAPDLSVLSHQVTGGELVSLGRGS
ncbi:MAG: hypothetical protein A2Z07_07490 [Armatimonadetes bacterium RBG_16_67_12]|nr:MAG: hypothetical protein A2Z07_07490 [Armatimonadetes bacterium RBG_16_67_12]